MRVWQEVRARPQGRACGAGTSHPCLGEFFTKAAQSRLRDDLSRDLDQDRQALGQVERVCQRELVKEREAHARRDDELDHGL